MLHFLGWKRLLGIQYRSWIWFNMIRMKRSTLTRINVPRNLFPLLWPFNVFHSWNSTCIICKWYIEKTRTSFQNISKFIITQLTLIFFTLQRSIFIFPSTVSKSVLKPFLTLITNDIDSYISNPGKSQEHFVESLLSRGKRRNSTSSSSSAKTGAARSKSETLNRALLSSFLAEFSDFEGMLGPVHLQHRLLLPSLSPPPPSPAHLSGHDRHPNQLALSTFSPLSRSRRGCPCRC